MTAKDVLKLLLVSYGFNKDVEITSYRGEFNAIGYDVFASNGEIDYHEVDCEGLMFHIYEIISFMEINKIKCGVINSRISVSELLKLNNEELSSIN